MPGARRRALIICGLHALAGPARADDTALAAASAAFDELRYEDGARLVEAGIRAGTNRPEQLARFFELGAQLAATMDQEEVAVDYFSRWLAIDGGAELAPGTSPRIVELFDRARREVPEPLELRATADGRAISVSIDSDPLGLVTAVLARRQGDDRKLEVEAAETGWIVRSPADAEALVIAAVDEYGNRLAETLAAPEVTHSAPEESAGEEVLDRSLPTIPRQEDHKPGPGLLARWPTWAVAAGTVAAASAYFSFRVHRDQDHLDDLVANSSVHEWEEVATAERELRRHSTIANIGWLTSAAAATVAITLYVREARDSKDHDLEIAVSPALSSVGASVTGHF